MFTTRETISFANGCCGIFGLFGRVLKVVLPNVSPVSVAGIFRGQHSVLQILTCLYKASNLMCQLLQKVISRCTILVCYWVISLHRQRRQQELQSIKLSPNVVTDLSRKIFFGFFMAAFCFHNPSFPPNVWQP